MKIFLAGPILLALFLAAGSPVWADTYRVATLNNDLELPWSLSFLPSGDMLVTEKRGRLLRIDESGSVTEIAGLPPVFFASQGGLMEVLVDPDHETSGWIYLSYAAGDKSANRTTVARARLVADRLEALEVILEVNTDKSGAYHYGGKLAFSGDGSLLVSVGEGYHYMDQAQSIESELGKLLRIDADGTAPADNPYPTDAPRVYSYGHRNPQGLAINPITGSLFMSEHGPKGGDELNIIEAGNNYGWPAITYGVDYSGEVISPHTAAEGMEQPVNYWVPSIALSGLTFYDGQMFPEFVGDAFIGALKDQKLYRLDMEGDTYVGQSEPFPEVSGRIRDVRIGPDGAIYALSDEGSVFRITRSE